MPHTLSLRPALSQKHHGPASGWSNRRRSLLRLRLTHVFAPASAALLATFSQAACAQTPPVLPQQGTFGAGAGSIGTATNGGLTITQAGDRAIIDWRTFSIGANGSVSIQNGAGATLNRVLGGDLSRIDGLLSATGSVYLINPNGIVVGAGGRVVTGGSFVASTRDIANGAFMSGGAMTASGTGPGTVTNLGSIVARDGDVVLIGRSVANSGDVVAAAGTVTLVAANSVLLTTVGGPSGVYVAPDTGADGSVSQSGRITAAAAALKSAGGDIYTLAGNRTGLIAATGTATIDGQVWLVAPHGDVSIGGAVTAVNRDGSGGGIVANGATVAITSTAAIAASGTQGGSVLLGVSTPGGSDLAERTTIADGASILAGGVAGGGLVETSGHHVTIGAATIAAGRGGSWRVDPVDLTIAAAAAGTIAASLDAGTNVLEQTSAIGSTGAGTAASGSGDLTVAAPITWTGSGTLTLDAYRDLNLNAAIGGGGGLVGTAGRAVNVGAAVSAATVSLSAGTGALTLATGTAISTSSGIMLASGGAFVNNAGAGALSPGAGRWLVYSADPGNDADGGLNPDFYQYAAAAGSALASSGNGRLFALAPSLAVALSGTVAKTYDGTAAAAFGTAASVTGLVNADVATVTGNFADKNAGTGIGVTATSIAVTHNGIAVYGYAGTSPSVTASIGRIDRAPLTASIVGTPTKTYNGTTTAALSSANYAFSGFIGGESASVSQASTVLYDSADAGARTITATFGATNFVAASGTALSNYILPTGAAGAGQIDQAPLRITGVLAVGKTYDRTAAGQLDVSSAGLYGIIGGDSVALVTSGAVGTFATALAGSNIVVAASGFTLTGTKAANYALVQPQGLTATISRASLGVNGVSALAKVYDGTTAAMLDLSGAGLSGVVGGDAVTLNGAGASGSFARADAGTAIRVGTTGFALAGVDAANYALTQPTGLAADITRRALTVTLTGTPSKTYNGSVNAVVGTADFTLSGFVAGQSATIGQTSNAAYASAHAGSQAIAVTLNPSDYVAGAGTTLSNYSLPTTLAGTGTIAAAPLTIAITGNPTKTYDGTTAATLSGANFELSGFLAGEGASVTQTVGAYASANAGVRGISTALGAGDFAAQGGTLLSDYVLPTVASGFGTIDPATLSGSIWAGITGNPTKPYDGTTVATLTASNFVLTGFATGDGASVTQTVGAYASRNAGVQTVVASLSASDFTPDAGTNLANYTLPTSAYGTGTITRAVLTAAITGMPSKVYNGTTSAQLGTSDVTIGGLAPGEGIAISPAAAASYDSRNAGARTVTATFSNTDISAQGGTLLSNYVLPTGASGSGTITLAPLTILGVTASDRAYDTTATAALQTGAARLFGAVLSDDVTLSAGGAVGVFATANAGSNLAVSASGFTIGGTDAANYLLLQPTGLTASISRAAVALASVAALDKVYDATSTASLDLGGATLVNVYGTDAGNVAFDASGATASFTSVNIGNGLRVTAGGIVLTGSAAGNYALSQPGGLIASITPAPLTAVIVGNPTKVYDGSASITLTSANYNLVGFVAGQGASVPQSATAHYDVADAGVQGISSTLVSSDFRANAGTNLSNYILPTMGTGTGTITRAPLAATIVGNPTRSYDAGTTAVLASANYLLTGFIGSQSASVTQTVGAYASPNAGLRGVSATLGSGDYSAGAGTNLSNYILPTVASGTGTITRAALQVTGVAATSRVYNGGLADALDVSGAGVSPLFGSDTVTLDASAATGLFASKNVGTGIAVAASGFTISGGQSANYILVQPTGLAADITPATLTLTGVTRIYDRSTALPAASAAYTYTGTYAGDVVALGASGVSGSYGDKNVGTGKSVSLTGLALTGAAAGNYVLGTVSGAAIGTITKAPLTVAGVAALDKVYDTTRTATLDNGAAVLAGLLSGDAVTLATSGGAGLFANKNVGTNKAVTLSGYSVSGADAGNYLFTQPVAVTASITRYGGISLASVTKTYSGNTTLAGSIYTLAGVLPGDVVSVATGGINGSYADKNAGSGIAMTLTGVALSGTDQGNYSIAPNVSGAAIGTIDRRTLTAAITNTPTKTYDAGNSATLGTGNFTLAGLVGGDAVSVTQTSGTYTSSNAGGSTVTASLAAGDFAPAAGTSLANYWLPTTATGIGTILKRALTVGGVVANDKTYNGNTVASLNVSSATLQNLATGDSALVTLGSGATTALFASAGVGSGIAVAASGFTISGSKAANYTLGQPTGLAASIVQATLNLVGVSRQYTSGVEATGAGVSYTLGGIVTGDSVSLATGGMTGSFADKNVGSAKSVSLTGLALTGSDAANYAIASTITGAAIGTVTAAPLTVSGAVAMGKTYDGTTIATISNAASVLNGVLGSDTVTLGAPTVGTFASANAGARAVTISGSYTIAGADAANYLLAQPTGLTATIAPRTLTATIVGTPTKTYDGTNVAVLASTNYALDGFVGAQGATVSHAAGTYASADAGSRTVSASLAAGDFTASGGALLSNYMLPTVATGAGLIGQRALNVAIQGTPTKTYDATATASLTSGNYLLTGFVSGQTASITQTGGAFAAADASSQAVTAALSASDFAAAGSTNLANYLLPTSATGAGTITRRTLTAAITGNPTRSYDGTTAATLDASNYTITGFVAGQGASIGQTAGTYASANAGSVVIATTFASSIVAASAGTNLANYVLPTTASGTGTITPRVLTASIVGTPTKTYDGSTTAALTASDYLLSGFIAGQGATVGQTAGRYATADAGSRTITADLATADYSAAAGTLLGNYLLPTTASGYGLITQRVLAAAIVGNPTKTYDATAVASLTSADYLLTGFVAGQGASITKSGGAYAGSDVGSYALATTLASGNFAATGGTDLANYVLPTSASGSGSIVRRALAAAITGAPAKTFDGSITATLSAGDYTLSGFVAGQGATVSQTSGTYASADAGSRTVTATLAASDLSAAAGTDFANYVLPASATGSGVIAQRVLTAAITGTPTRTYDGTTAATLSASDYTLAGFVAGQGASVGQALGSYSAAGAGSRGVTAILSAGSFTSDGATDLANYVLPTSASGTGLVTRRALTAAITGNPTKTYDAAASATLGSGDYTLAGFVGGEGASVTNTGGTYAGIDAGLHGVTIALSASDFAGTGGTELGNYLLPTVASGAGTISPRLLTASITGTPTKTYDGTTTAALSPGNYLLSGFVAGQGALVTATGGTYATADAGDRAVTAALTAADIVADTGTNLANYVLPASAAGTGTIGRRALAASITGTPSKIYDGGIAATLTAADFGLAGFVTGEGASVVQAHGSYAAADVGSVAVGATLSGGSFVAAAGTDLANYLLPVGASGLGTITPRAITATIAGTPRKTYDATTAAALSAANYALAGFVAGQGTTVGQTAGRYASADAGSRGVVALLSPGDFAADAGTRLSNYVLPDIASGVGVIDPRALAVAITGTPARAYDGTTAAALTAADYTMSGFVASQGARVTQANGTYASADAGTHAVTAGIGVGNVIATAGTDLANYQLPATAGGVGTITPRLLTATIVGTPTRMADGTTVATLSAGNFTLDGFVAGQGATVVQTVGQFDGVAAGDHVVAATLGAGMLSAGANTLLANYAAPASASGTGRITPAVLFDTGSLYAAIATNLAVRNLADAANIAGTAQRAALGASLNRTYIPYPAPSALSTWQTNGFAPLPSIVSITRSQADDGLATRTATPIINSTQQILLQGGAGKAWRIELPPLARASAVPADGTFSSEHAR